MILKALKHTRYPGEPREWNIVGNNNDYAYFHNINLLVGQNASGKSRTLYVVREIASILSGRVKLDKAHFASQQYDLLFEHKDVGSTAEYKYRYIMSYKDGFVIAESLYLNGVMLFERSDSEIVFGKDFSKEQQSQLRNVDAKELLIVAADEDQKNYFELFVLWGKSLRNYLFADQVKKRQLIEDLSTMKNPERSKEITGALLFTFCMGQQEFGDAYLKDLKDSMAAMGYNDVSDIVVHKEPDGYCIGIEEQGKYVVSQREMSQGMFRTLSIFVFIIYARMKNISACVLIDDIGEGMDYDRSRRLIGLIIRKLHDSSIQCFMSTNDRMVMNDIPLRFWSVVDRQDATTSVVYDFENTREVYDDFKFTGLNNFEFFTTNFYKEGFGAEEDEDVDGGE